MLTENDADDDDDDDQHHHFCCANARHSRTSVRQRMGAGWLRQPPRTVGTDAQPARRHWPQRTCISRELSQAVALELSSGDPR